MWMEFGRQWRPSRIMPQWLTTDNIYPSTKCHLQLFTSSSRTHSWGFRGSFIATAPFPQKAPSLDPQPCCRPQRRPPWMVRGHPGPAEWATPSYPQRSGEPARSRTCWINIIAIIGLSVINIYIYIHTYIYICVCLSLSIYLSIYLSIHPSRLL